MKKIINLFLAFLCLLFSTAVFAQEPFFIKGNVEVPAGCEITDTGGKLHVFPKESSPSGLLGICALPTAKTAGVISEFSFVDFGFGLFLNSINNVSTSPDWDLSWSLFHNGEFAQVGLADLAISGGDTLSFIYTSFSNGEEFDKLVLNILSEPKPSSRIERGASPGVAAHNFSAEKAIHYLARSQATDGSFENPMFTDWSALAFAAYDLQHEAIPVLKNYLINNSDPGQSLGPSVLGHIRRAMALMALGINPYSGTAVNYIQEIVKEFDGNQIGDKALVNDDIFASLVLSKAGFDSSDQIMQKIVHFILNNQKPDGSWTGGVDMTSAAIQSLVLVSDIKEVPESLVKARTYLESQQQGDGGFGNADSTSWAMQAIAALGEDWRGWQKNGTSPGSYLFYLQRQDGSVLSVSPVWSTAYAVPGVLGKPWSEILQSFARQDLSFSGLGEVMGEFIDLEQKNEFSQIAFEIRLIEEEIMKIKNRLIIIILAEKIEEIKKMLEQLQKR